MENGLESTTRVEKLLRLPGLEEGVRKLLRLLELEGRAEKLPGGA